ncbi:MAG: DUF4364 family protein [Clostridia bacterium]|nr:DUF4364 family protein [Clostridia bacterium]
MDYEFDAFTEGVDAGGLRSKKEIKLIIEYLVLYLNDSVTSDVVIEALTGSALANYFETTQAVDELVASGNLTRGENNELTITKKGSDSLKELMDGIPASVREAAMTSASIIQLRNRNEGAANAAIVKNGEAYEVVCKIMHKDTVLVELKLHADDYTQASKIKKSFVESPEKIYEAVVSLLY